MFKFAAITLLLTGALSAGALMPVPSVNIMIGGGSVVLEDPTVTPLPGDAQAWTWATFSDGETWEVSSMFFSFKQDPFVDYGIAVKNFSGAPLMFTFVFLAGYGGGPYTLLDSSHSSSVTDGGNGLVVVTPGMKADIHTPELDGTDFLAAAIGMGCAPAGAPGFSAACEAGNSMGHAIASAVAGTLAVTVSFTLSPGDIYTANGRVEIYNNPIPEPSTYAMAVAGIGLLFVVRRFRG